MQRTKDSLSQAIFAAASFVALLWLIKLLEVILSADLYSLGVYPRTESGLIGIITAPLVHGSWQHLIANSLPLLLLGSLTIYGYPKSRWPALALMWLLSGLGVWIFARSSFHFGASGLTHGMFFYLLFGGILRRDRRSVALLMIAFFMYSGMLMSIFPGEPGISFEYHLFGAASGALAAFSFRHWDPKPVRKRYAWQRNPGDGKFAEEEDPIIGDQWKTEQQRAAEELRSRE